ncbi:MAG: hypothetical protein IJK96_00155 [Bacteroidales bacterium]|nr:hypothetical protein [Bacteroidales bacterium]
MKPYLQDRQKNERRSRIAGAIAAAGVWILASSCLAFTGIKYIYPPPAEQTFVIDFTQEEDPVEIQRQGRQPMAEEPDPTKPVELIQKAESPIAANTKRNSTPATKPDAFGDVEVPTPKQEPELDPRASFPGMAKKDSSYTAPHSADEASDSFKAGQPDGNTKVGPTDGTPNARVKGRNTLGALPRPSYPVQKSGTVVVKVWVDNYGNVKKAVPGADGTTVTDDKLWAAARNAAMKTHFNESIDAPAMQEGTITYIFKLK